MGQVCANNQSIDPPESATEIDLQFIGKQSQEQPLNGFSNHSENFIPNNTMKSSLSDSLQRNIQVITKMVQLKEEVHQKLMKITLLMGNGQMVNQMDMEFQNSQTVIITKEIQKMDNLKMKMDIFKNQMVNLYMKVHLKMEDLMDKVLQLGKTEKNIKDNFKTEIFMAKVHMNGQMEENLLEIMLKDKNMEMVKFFQTMEQFMLGNGITEIMLAKE